ncbi:MAG: hypothetical protein KGM49_00420 [Sphingomonadales bacterium]|nr:hypothetical protein [Sphingomonadales bacterium]
MAESKPFASLSPNLLARKGGARPAMRPQLGPLQHDALARQIEDLGWNDMGHDEDEHGDSAEVISLNPDSGALNGHEPAVVRQQRSIARRVADERRSALADGRRAAFTLRVDAERHLKLRLACTVKGRSAQQLVTDAIDRLLSELPDVVALAEQVGKTPRKAR